MGGEVVRLVEAAKRPVDAVAEGAQAWGRIKESARRTREDWRLVGEALLVGRREHEADRDFGRWCEAHGFGDMDRRQRARAMELAREWDSPAVAGVLQTDTGANYPEIILKKAKVRAAAPTKRGRPRKAAGAAAAGSAEASEPEMTDEEADAALTEGEVDYFLAKLVDQLDPDFFDPEMLRPRPLEMARAGVARMAPGARDRLRKARRFLTMIMGDE